MVVPDAVTGTTAKPNGESGIFVHANGNTIGGTTPAARNVIGGHPFSGISVIPFAAQNVVEGNFVGTDRSGYHARS